jgi:sugar phosphate isomerase/epimerase
MFAHMRELADYVVVVTWWGRGGKDGEGMDTDALMARLFDVAEETGTMLAFHVEPYQGRTARTVLDDIKYIIDKYGDSPAFYRDPARCA